MTTNSNPQSNNKNIDITSELNILYQTAIDQQDYPLALRILQAIPKQNVQLPPLSALSDETLQYLIDTWSAEINMDTTPETLLPTESTVTEPIDTDTER